ncbi:RING-H2 finger protein ATL78-like [Cucurbita pepo subsp. pepo]|uniref:RING-H2 finger protein ATL78-like n=1 Tax=Cucurbita pepo subsp. pepo TaxID=3664 RepID=UPI000C9D495B|nr:RING-H2 finger protein ATL78-like [Cucurbita pepo subsp. pepo]
MSIQFTSIHGQQDFHYSRKLFTAAAPSALHNPLQSISVGGGGPDTSFDTNVVMVLSVLLCALICSLGLNSIIRCAFKCSRIVVSHDHRPPTTTTAAPTGVHKKAIKSFTVVQFSPELNFPGMDSECIICLSDFAAGDKLRLLPKCNHGFHVRCIDKWLTSHSSCPKCRQCLVQTCQKIADVGSSTSTSGQPPPPVLNLTPVDHEDPVRI